jgi:hypothetical protein
MVTKLTAMEKTSPPSLFRLTALIVLSVGAVWSLSLTLQAGRNNDSILLKILFMVWVLSPYLMQLAAFMLSTHWKNLRRIILYLQMIFLSFGSLLFYSGIINLPNSKPAAVFLFVPLISWFLIAIIQTIAIFLSRMLTRMKDNI